MPENILPRKDVTRESLGDHALTSDLNVPVRDVRLAVTLVGGISLAVYECGAAMELHRAVLGEGMYSLLKRITQSHVYIDIVSGTSAGGINGICLATALANGTSLNGLRDIWLNNADIDKLLTNPASSDATALFQGDSYYTPQIERLFRTLVTTGGKAVKPALHSTQDTSEDEIELLVTGTYYENQPRVFYDQRSKPIYTNNFAGLFRLKHRPAFSVSHLNPGPEDAKTNPYICRLARIARTTSSLPAVFEPSEVTEKEINFEGGGDPVIELAEDGARQVNYMMDGGFLNNRPINHALDAIYRRTATREILRKLVFVEPVAVRIHPPTAGNEPKSPNMLEALAFFNSVPSKQNLSATLRSVAEWNEKSARMEETVGLVRARMATADHDSQRKLHAELCINDLMDRLCCLWQKELSLDYVNDLHTVKAATPEEMEQKQREQAETKAALEVLCHLLREVMKARCSDLCKPKNGKATGIWELADTDAWYLERLIELARREIRLFLFPNTPLESQASVQQTRQKVKQRINDPSDKSRLPAGTEGPQEEAQFDAIMRQLAGINHLRDISECLRETTEKILQKVAKPTSNQGGDLTLFEKALQTVKTELAKGNDPLADAQILSLLKTIRSVDVPKGSLLNEHLKTRKPTQESPIPVIMDRILDLWDTLYILTACIECPFSDWKIDLSKSSRAENFKEFRKRITARQTGLLAIVPKQTKASTDETIQTLKNKYGESLPADEKDPLIKTVFFSLFQTVADIARSAETELAERNRKLREDYADDCAAKPAALLQFSWAYTVREPSVGRVLNADEIGKQLTNLDAILYPILRMSENPLAPGVGLIYISAATQQTGLSKRPAADKLAGDALGNFGGFLKRSWRANDLMWGRFDTAGGLLDALLDKDRVRRLCEADDKFPEALKNAVLGYVNYGNRLPDPIVPDQTGTVIANELKTQHEEITKWDIGTSWRDGFDVDPSTGKVNVFDAMKEAILWRHHLDILEQELPRAIGAALSEYTEQQARGLTGEETSLSLLDNPCGEKKPADLKEDRKRIMRAGNRLTDAYPETPDPPTRMALQDRAESEARRLLNSSATTPNGNTNDIAAFLEWFQKGKYQIGKESVEADVPVLVSLHRVSQAVLVTAQILSSIAGEQKPGHARAFMDTLNNFVLKPLSVLLWIVFRFSQALALGKRAYAALLAFLGSILTFLPFFYFLGAIDDKFIRLGITLWLLTLGITVVTALFKHNKVMAFMWGMASIGVALIAYGVGEPGVKWPIPVGEFLVLITGIYSLRIRRGGRLQYVQVYSAAVIAVGVSFLLLAKSGLLNGLLGESGGDRAFFAFARSNGFAARFVKDGWDRLWETRFWLDSAIAPSPHDIPATGLVFASGVLLLVGFGVPLMGMIRQHQYGNTPWGVLSLAGQSGEQFIETINFWTQPARTKSDKRLKSGNIETLREASLTVVRKLVVQIGLNIFAIVGIGLLLAASSAFVATQVFSAFALSRDVFAQGVPAWLRETLLFLKDSLPLIIGFTLIAALLTLFAEWLLPLIAMTRIWQRLSSKTDPVLKDGLLDEKSPGYFVNVTTGGMMGFCRAFRLSLQLVVLLYIGIGFLTILNPLLENASFARSTPAPSGSPAAVEITIEKVTATGNVAATGPIRAGAVNSGPVKISGDITATGRVTTGGVSVSVGAVESQGDVNVRGPVSANGPVLVPVMTVFPTVNNVHPLTVTNTHPVTVTNQPVPSPSPVDNPIPSPKPPNPSPLPPPTDKPSPSPSPRKIDGIKTPARDVKTVPSPRKPGG